jgi:F-type H+-transporting ATPase subunit alpha
MKKVSGELKLLYSQYRELQAFAQFGSDLDKDTKDRLNLGERIVEVLKQGRNSPVRVGCQVAIVYAVVNGYLNSVPVKQVKEYERTLYELLESKYHDFLLRVESGSWDEKDIEELKAALGELKR